MSDMAIEMDRVYKRYQLGTHVGYGRLTESLSTAISRSRKIFKAHPKPPRSNHFDALEDITLEVKVGEVLGVIGRNGAGKTTLLKILCRITRPTQGRAILRGRVGSILEVGTGFHPELTGLENVYLNGAILGMRRTELKRKLDEIIDFSGVEKFLDTPLKRYSTGMYLRLAFAVAAHLEPEVLIVDEVLAVGDARFQKKCLGKMAEMGDEGRTVMFVSHSMPSVLRLCERVVLLEKGRKVADGPSQGVVARYLDESGTGEKTANRSWPDPQDAPGDDKVRLSSVRVTDVYGSTRAEASILERIGIEVQYEQLVGTGEQKLTTSIQIFNETGVCLFCSNDFNNKVWWKTARAPGSIRATCWLPGNFLAEGKFLVTAAVCTYNPNKIHVLERDVVAFVIADRTTGEGVRGEHTKDWPGVVRPMLDWTVEHEGD